MNADNIYSRIPDELPAELINKVVTNEKITIERIVSKGHITPPGEWYDQPGNEWVLLLKGEARLNFDSEPELLHLRPGMYINIPAHTRHRVEWTKENEETIWLAVHYSE